MKWHAFATTLLVVSLFKVNTIEVVANVETQKCDADFWPAQLLRIERHMDESVSPCEDFYEYACGNWRAAYQLRALGARDTLTAVKADNKRLLLKHFEQTAERHAVVDFYNSCLDARSKTSQSDAMGVYVEVLKQFSEWPILSADFERQTANVSFNWAHMSAQLRRFGVQTFWRLTVQPNWQAAEQRIFYITPPAFHMLKQHKTAESYDADSVYLYERYVKYLMLDLGLRVRHAKSIASEVVAFDKQLMALATDERLLVLQEPLTLTKLARELPDVKLQEYFGTLLHDLELPANYAQQLLIVTDKSYLTRLAQFLAQANTTTIAKYMLVQFLAHFEVHLHADDTLNEQKAYCLQQAHSLLPQELSTLFLQLQHNTADGSKFLQRTQTHLGSIFEQLKVQFEKMLNKTNIFERDAVAKALGLEKLRAMRLLLPPVQIEQSTAAVSQTSIHANFDQNLLNLSLLRTKQQLTEIIDTLKAAEGRHSLPTTTTTDAAYGPLDVNAYYRLKKNAIELPIGILRVPLYDACLQPANIYGSFVYILAHELLHGFDYDGLNYDKSGNVANGWGAKSIIRFGVSASCYFAERYRNASLTINENIADSEGLRLSLETFTHASVSRADAINELEAGQLKTEELKLFFLSFAQTWCGTSATTAQHSQHAGHRERVNNVVSNFPEFAQAFKCHANSRMHPEEKCRIW